jgi:hypothetical protein
VTINLENAWAILLALGVGLLLLPLSGNVAKVCRYIVGGGLVLLGAIRFFASFSASA